jgi:drug/metabolite transporter (DMT)-like permease
MIMAELLPLGSGWRRRRPLPYDARVGDQRQATLYGLGAVLLWSTVAAAFKLALRDLAPAPLLFYASLTALLLLGALLLAQGKARLLRACTRRQLGRALLLGLLNPFVYYLVLFKAYDLLPAQVAQPLNFTWALVLGLLSIPLLGQRFRLRDLLAGLICYGGVLIISTQGDLLGLRVAEPLGVALALGSTLIWAFYWLLNARNELDPTLGLFLNFLLGLPFVFLFALLFSDLRLPGARALLGAVYVGVVEMGVAFALWLTALRLSSSATRIANLIFIAPFLSLVFIRLTVGERIVPATLIGLVFIVGGLILQQTGGRSGEEAAAAPRAAGPAREP